MAYHIDKTFYNGYVCGCCFRTWEGDSEWEADEEDALRHLQADSYFPDIMDGDLYEITITDGETGEEIAAGKLDWPSTSDKYIGNRYRRWSGHIRGEPFSTHKAPEEMAGKTWQEILDHLKAEDEKKELEKLDKKIADLSARREALRARYDQ